MLPARPLSRINHMSSIKDTATFSSSIPNSSLMMNSRVINGGYIAQPPILMKQETNTIEPSINGLVRNDTKATISSSPLIFEPLKAQNIEVVRPFSRRQQILIESGGCVRVSNTCSAPGPCCLKCIPRWVLIILGLLLLSAIIFGAIKLFLMHSHQCRSGLHFMNGKCYGCPEGSDWDGQNCLKDYHAINSGQQYNPHSGYSVNEQTQHPNQNLNIVNQNDSSIYSNRHHLRHRM